MAWGWYEVYADYQVEECRVDYAAIGSGFSYALGALYATDTRHTLLDGRGRVEQALQCSSEFSTGVRGPFTILSMGAQNQP